MSIEEKMISWYYQNKRDFPFRNTRNPYKIWVSEVMSQQTQMSRVVPFYERFISMFPTVFDLAAASEEMLLKAWEGLGYYSRVRNMQVAAQTVVDEMDGQFPKTYDTLLMLKGIGTYTAAAIASICFNEPVAAVDGNVLRVYSRYMMYDKDILSQKNKNEVMREMNTWMSGGDCGGFNQAFIELGATICTPTSPKCVECPLSDNCLARAKDRISGFPVKKKKVKVTHESLNTYIFIDQQGAVYVEKQTDQFLGGMYLLPQFTDEDDTTNDILKVAQQLSIVVQEDEVEFVGEYKHIFSHKVWKMRFYLVPVTGEQNEKFYQLSTLPVAHAHRNFLVSINLIETVSE